MGSQEEKILYSLGSTVAHPCWLVVPAVLFPWGRGYRGETSKVSENPQDYLHHCFLCSKPSTVRLPYMILYVRNLESNTSPTT